MSWQPAFCERNEDRPECAALDGNDFAAQHLSLHGLWPNDGPGEGPSYCGIDAAIEALDRPESWCQLPEPAVSAKTEAALSPVMPGVSSCLDRHEWIKHGTCADISAEAYFAGSLRLAAAVEATAFAQTIAASVGRNVGRQQLINAFESAFGRGSARAITFICQEQGGTSYLAEVRIALKPKALDGGLDREDLYLDGPPPAGSCPETIRIDPVG